MKLDCPTYATDRHGVVPVVDAVATYDEATGHAAIFLVNRSLKEAAEVVVDTRLLGDVTISSAVTLWDEDIHAANTVEQPNRVGLRPNESARLTGEVLRITLPPVSWTAVSLN